MVNNLLTSEAKFFVLTREIGVRIYVVISVDGRFFDGT